MMAAYTIEDIELIRRKSGISYQEAVALLDYHNGNVARALIDLEKNGKLNNNASNSQDKKETSKAGIAGNLLQRLYRARLKVRKGDITILNFSALFSIVCLIFSPHMAIAGLILSLVLGYRISFDKADPAFAGDNLEKMVRSAADNVKNSVSDMAKGFTDNISQYGASNHQGKSESQNQQSYYESQRNKGTKETATVHNDIPTMQIPVKVESDDGKVQVEHCDDGYGSATIG